MKEEEWSGRSNCDHREGSVIQRNNHWSSCRGNCVCDVCQGVCSWENLVSTAETKERRGNREGTSRLGGRGLQISGECEHSVPPRIRNALYAALGESVRLLQNLQEFYWS
ncbi:hypothetical protein CRENBAI_009124 [Crenichthys baileyi]|uniref:Uncharacterized protein n=1 Tax=Crenichthys baileyi TaxID=28760 RepID=A0AAV9QUB8_9TELE